MRGFIIICLASLAVAAPQTAYYQPYGAPLPTALGTQAFLKDLQVVMAAQTGHFSSVPSQTEQTNGPVSNFPVYTQPQYLPPTNPANNNEVYDLPTTTSGAHYAQSSTPMHSQGQQHQVNGAPAEAVVTKRFFIHSAPEDDNEDVREQILTVGKPRKNYNVVFIKAPARSNKKNALKIKPAVNEEKTVIYVLAKKQDASDFEAQIQEPATTTSKPEVFFIKYKTNEEADHAQHTIQAQYDVLGGATHISNEGTAPVSSVIGALDGHNSIADGQEQSAEAILDQPPHYSTTNNGYLPPSQYYH